MSNKFIYYLQYVVNDTTQEVFNLKDQHICPYIE